MSLPTFTRANEIGQGMHGGAVSAVDPWPATDNQNFHEPRVHDFAFIDINGDGCFDLFLGLCSGYQVLINTTPGCVGEGL